MSNALRAFSPTQKAEYLPAAIALKTWGMRMTENDLNFIRRCLKDDLVRGDVLELGGGYGGDTCRDVIMENGLPYFTTDLAEPVAKVDFIANFETGEGVDDIARIRKFDTVLVLNVLEHTFEPARILDHARRLLKDGGNIVISTPCVWPIHNYPIDCCRLLPDWYRRYAATRGLTLADSHFVFLGYGAIKQYHSNGTDNFPGDPRLSGWQGLTSRLAYGLLSSFGPGRPFRPFIAIGAVLRS